MAKRILIIGLFLLLIVPPLIATEFQIKLGLQFWAIAPAWPEVEASVLTSPTERGFQQEFGVRWYSVPLYFILN